MYMYASVKRPDIKIDPPDVEKLAAARRTRLNEMKMHGIIKEVVFYFLFLSLILLVVGHNREPSMFRMKESMKNMVSPNNYLQNKVFFR